MQRGSFQDPVKAWAEATEKLAAAFNSMRQVFGNLSTELEEMEKQLHQVVDSVSGTLERLSRSSDKKRDRFTW